MAVLPAIDPFRRRLDELAANMAEPAFYANPRRAADITREHQKLVQLAAEHHAHERLEREIAEAEALLKERDAVADADLRELAAAELPSLIQRRDELKRSVLLA